MVLDHLAAIQALVVGVLFAWAGVWKVFFPSAHSLAAESALAKLMTRLPVGASASRRLTQAAHLAVGAVEIAIAGALLLPPAHPWAMRLAAVFALGFLAYLGVAWRVAPDKPCACMGGRATKISRRSVARAGVLLALTLFGWPAQVYWGTAVVAAPWTVLVVGAEATLLWLLSPEFGWAGVRFERRLIRAARLRLDPACARVAFDWDALEQQLRRSFAFQQVVRRAQVKAQADRWREDCTAYLAYHAVYQGRAATAIFAIPVIYDPREVTGAVVDAADETVYFRVAAQAETSSSESERAAAALLD
jgi:hypothetical protein